MHILHLRLLLPILCTTLPLAAQTTVTISPDRDNTLYEDNTGFLSNGAGQNVFAGLTGQPLRRRALLHFDVAGAVPANSMVLSASLWLNVSRSLPTAQPLRVDVHRVLANWGEGTSVAFGQGGAGGVATTNDATWLHTFWSGSFWTTPGGNFAATSSASGLAPPLSGATVWSSPQLAADVQSFLHQPAQNFGWMLKTDEQFSGQVRRFDSRENVVAANRPALTITFLPPGSVQTVGTGCPRSTGGTFQLTTANLPLSGSNNFTLVHNNGQAGALGGNFVALGALDTPISLYPGCNLWLNPFPLAFSYNVLQLDGSGSSQTVFPIPNGFPGFVVCFQGWCGDSGISPQGFVGSNAVRVVIN